LLVIFCVQWLCRQRTALRTLERWPGKQPGSGAGLPPYARRTVPCDELTVANTQAWVDFVVQRTDAYSQAVPDPLN